MTGPGKSVKVRRYRPEDARDLERMVAEGPMPEEVLEREGQAWTALSEGRCLGYATVSPLPGLDGIVDLRGYVRRQARRQGVGSRLLQQVLRDLSAADVARVTHVVPSLHGPAAGFLRRHGFFLEHEEWEMALTLADAQPAPAEPSLLAGDVRLETLHAGRALDLFRRLYEESFGGRPWYQPYSRQEVASELLPGPSSRGDVQNILFLTRGEEALGFAAVAVSGDEGQIEPMGIVGEKQGQGLGRSLLLATLGWLRERGVARVRVGVWRSNERAVALYRRAGFRRVDRRFFLAYTLSG